MKVAVIGTGKWGRNLARNLHEFGALGAAAGIDPASRENLAAEYPGLVIHEDYRALLKNDITAVAIATPAPTHYRITEDALLAGKDVFVEKPLALSAGDAVKLAELADKEGRILMVGHLLLYQPAIQWIKQYLQSGALGTVYSLHQERLNLGKARSVENALWSLGVHDIAVALHLVGAEPERVLISGQSMIQPAVEDDVYLHLEFPGGIRAHLHNSWLWPEKRRRLTVVGAKGILVYDELEQKVALHRKGIASDLTNRDEGSELVFDGSGAPLKIELEHYLARLEDRRTPLSDGRSGAAVIRVLEKATKLLEMQ